MITQARANVLMLHNKIIASTIEKTVSPGSKFCFKSSKVYYGGIFFIIVGTMSDSVWQYFTKTSDDKARCHKCINKTISCKGGSTSGLIRHLVHIHNINLLKRKNEENIAGPSNAQTPKLPKPNTANISSFLTGKKTMAEIVARLAAVDGFTIHGITNSSFIRQSMENLNFSMPKNKSGVMKLIHNYYDVARSSIVDDISRHKTKNGKFSATFDEWTSTKNRRYLNVNIFYENKFVNLGLVRIPGSSPADVINNIVFTKLSEFEIDKTDIVSFTTDGASVMVKFGKGITNIHQLCYNHAIHLAVIDVLYKKHNNECVGTSYLSESSDDDDVSDNDENSQCFEAENIKPALNMVRCIVKFFKRSPIKNNILQEYVLKEHNKELQLLLDCPTRWNSMETMLDRFLAIFDSVQKALNDLNALNMLDNKKIDILKHIHNMLKPIKLAVEALGRRDINLITADAILNVLLNTLSKNDDNISAQILIKLKERINERRNIELVSLLKFLQTLNLTSSTHLKVANKSTVFNYACSIYKILFFSDELEDVTENSESDNESNENIDFVSQLTNAVNDSMTKKMSKRRFNLKQELMTYETTGNLTHNLNLLLSALKTIPPTSVESERVFSLSSNFCRKKRSSLSDKSLDCLTFLKSFFLNKNRN